LAAAPGERLDDKIASLTLPNQTADCTAHRYFSVLQFYITILLVPPPSTDESAWWEKLGEFKFNESSVTAPIPFVEAHNGRLAISPVYLEDCQSNPFDSPGNSSLSSPLSSDEELYSRAADLPGLPSPITPMPVNSRTIPNTDYL